MELVTQDNVEMLFVFALGYFAAAVQVYAVVHWRKGK